MSILNYEREMRRSQKLDLQICYNYLMRIDLSRWSPEELIVMEAYNYMCVLCGFQYADTLHHEPPRSLNPNHKDQPWTQFPLCAAHHDAVQDMPREEAEELILRHVDIFFPGAIEKVKELSLVSNTQR